MTIDVLANDHDIDGDGLAVVSVTQPAGGIAVVNPDGTIQYTPNAGFSGTDVFSYVVNDSAGETATAVVRVDVTAPLGTAGKVTGGGSLDGGVHFSFAIDARQIASGLVFDGNMEYHDKSSGVKFKATDITLLHIDENGEHAYFTGEGTLNGKAATPSKCQSPISVNRVATTASRSRLPDPASPTTATMQPSTADCSIAAETSRFIACDKRRHRLRLPCLSGSATSLPPCSPNWAARIHTRRSCFAKQSTANAEPPLTLAYPVVSAGRS